jgi:hypothetical protein
MHLLYAGDFCRPTASPSAVVNLRDCRCDALPGGDGTSFVVTNTVRGKRLLCLKSVHTLEELAEDGAVPEIKTPEAWIEMINEAARSIGGAYAAAFRPIA